MKSSYAGLLLSALMLMLWCPMAWAQPASIPQSATAPHDCAQTFRTLKQYFSDPAMSQFKLTSANEMSGTIAAKRDNIDTSSWNQWAYCKMSPTHMLDTLQNGAVTVSITTRRAGNEFCYVSVKADFEGTYGLGSSSSTDHCISKGVLENNLLATAGVTTPPPGS